MLDPIIPFILAGGAGLRLWPLSTPQRPKPLLSISSPETLLEQTVNRLKYIANISSPVLLCSDQMADIVSSECYSGSFSYIIEPQGKNTAAACIISALYAQQSHSQAMVLMLACDHFISPPNAFARSIHEALPAVTSGKLVTFGITPDSPNEGYGYITADANGNIEAFHEKPDHASAQSLIARGALWNSGMFLWRADCLVAEAQKHCPDLLEGCKAALAQAKTKDKQLWLNESQWQLLESQPVDRVIMEKTDKGWVQKADFAWSDMGTFEAWWKHVSKDKHGNAIQGKVRLRECSQCLVINETDKLIELSHAHNQLWIRNATGEELKRPLKVNQSTD